MTIKSKLHTITRATVVTAAIAVTAAMTGGAQAENHHYPKLKPADPPCLYLMDENGNPTGAATNAPCTQSSAKGRELDKSTPMLAKELDKSSPMMARGQADLREKGSGMATGKR